MVGRFARAGPVVGHTGKGPGSAGAVYRAGGRVLAVFIDDGDAERAEHEADRLLALA